MHSNTNCSFLFLPLFLFDYPQLNLELKLVGTQNGSHCISLIKYIQVKSFFNVHTFFWFIIFSSSLLPTYGATYGSQFLFNMFFSKGEPFICQEITYGRVYQFAKLLEFDIHAGRSMKLNKKSEIQQF